MRYRKITTHLKRQNWLGIIIDFFIVVAGVLIALQLGDWQQALKDAKDQKHYLLALHSDLSSSIESVDTALTENSNFDNFQQITLEVLEGLELNASNRLDFERGLATVGLYSVPVRSWSHFEEMTEAGMLRKLESEALKRRIIAAYDADHDFSTFMNYMFNYATPIVSDLKQQYSMSYTNQEENARFEVSFDLAELRDSPFFIHGFRNAKTYLTINRRFLEGLREPLVLARDSIASYLQDKYQIDVTAEGNSNEFAIN